MLAFEHCTLRATISAISSLHLHAESEKSVTSTIKLLPLPDELTLAGPHLLPEEAVHGHSPQAMSAGLFSRQEIVVPHIERLFPKVSIPELTMVRRHTPHVGREAEAHMMVAQNCLPREHLFAEVCTADLEPRWLWCSHGIDDGEICRAGQRQGCHRSHHHNQHDQLDERHHECQG